MDGWMDNGGANQISILSKVPIGKHRNGAKSVLKATFEKYESKQQNPPPIL